MFDDTTHEAAAIVAERAIGGELLTSTMKRICKERVYPQITRTDNGKELCGRLRNECLNENWFLNMHNARVLIEAWSKEYNEERSKKALGGLSPTAYATLLAMNPVTVNPGL